MLTGDFENDFRRAWEGYEELLALHPVLLAQLAARGIASLYPNDADASRFVNLNWPTLMLSFGPPSRPTIFLAPAGAKPCAAVFAAR